MDNLVIAIVATGIGIAAIASFRDSKKKQEWYLETESLYKDHALSVYKKKDQAILFSWNFKTGEMNVQSSDADTVLAILAKELNSTRALASRCWLALPTFAFLEASRDRAFEYQLDMQQGYIQGTRALLVKKMQ